YCITENSRTDGLFISILFSWHDWSSQHMHFYSDSHSPSSYCEPFAHDEHGEPIAPCGAIANSMFNDSFTLTYHPPDGAEVPVPLYRRGITWYTDKNVKFRNPPTNTTLQLAFQGTAQPLFWQQPVYELDPADPSNNGFINDDLIVWMREAAFPNFKKLYGILIRAETPFSEGLPAGNYSVNIIYSILYTNIFPGQEGSSSVHCKLVWWAEPFPAHRVPGDRRADLYSRHSSHCGLCEGRWRVKD
uniref:Transmembrane protein 30C n=1 Tax=Astyanax mexicanus TaxID=7994 RepID=A0A8B9GNK0_ASTMX